MNYTWDENKRALNVKKHSIDFPTAIDVFHDENRVETLDDRDDYGEERIQTIGYAMPGLLFVVYTYRDNESTRRFISARRANRREKALYNSMIGF